MVISKIKLDKLQAIYKQLFPCTNTLRNHNSLTFKNVCSLLAYFSGNVKLSNNFRVKALRSADVPPRDVKKISFY